MKAPRPAFQYASAVVVPAILVWFALSGLAHCEEVRYVNVAPLPYSGLADQAALAWNRNGCVTFVRADEGPVIVGAYRFGPTEWGGMAWQYGDTPVHQVFLNASVMEKWGAYYLLAAYCHEWGHVLKLEHSTDPASCMGLTYSSAAPSSGDLAAVRGRCSQ